ncbi:MAGE-domain-containing protein [Xylariaceae sp. FL0016]|nr:MAGE-domain-containing protein [Xylariaceae sp. FL0016]
MPPRSQARRRTGNRESDEEDDPRRRQTRHNNNSDDDMDDDDDDDDDSDKDEDGDHSMNHTDSTDDQLIKKLVRYALACEYARIPIKRDGIRDKVLGNNPRAFRRVFDGAQTQLQKVFGTQMRELPVREKRTLREKQKAAARKTGSQNPASRSYVLISTLPREYRAQTIIGPSRIPSSREEAEYVGFYMMTIALIALSGGELSDVKFRRHLTRLNANTNLPMDKTENVLIKMTKQGYVDKVVEKSDGDEDTITWCIGPRGKVEVPAQSIALFVEQVWGEKPDDFDKKLERSLGIQKVSEIQAETSIAEQEVEN